MHVSGIDFSNQQLKVANNYLLSNGYSSDRYALHQGDACSLLFPNSSFDAAYISWLLEHVAKPHVVLKEAWRVLAPNSPICTNEALQICMHTDMPTTYTNKCRNALDNYQYQSGGDPRIGLRLANLLLEANFTQIHTQIKTLLLDQRQPELRQQMLKWWRDTLLYATKNIFTKHEMDKNIIGMQNEFAEIIQSPTNAVMLFSFVQATALRV